MNNGHGIHGKIKSGVSEQVRIRHSDACRTKAHVALNARKAARRVSEVNNHGKLTRWKPAFAGVTAY